MKTLIFIITLIFSYNALAERKNNSSVEVFYNGEIIGSKISIDGTSIYHILFRDNLYWCEVWYEVNPYVSCEEALDKVRKPY